MEKNFDHEVIYTNANPIPIADVAASLLANEQLLRDAVSLLEDLFPGLAIEKVDISFRSASTTSPLKEILAGAIFLAYHEDLEAEVPLLIEQLTGVHIPSQLDGAVTALVFVVAVYGIAKAMELFGRKRTISAQAMSDPPAIEGNFNTVLKIGGDAIGVAPDQIREALESKFRGPKQRSLAKRSLEFIRPAKHESGAAVVGAGLTIDPQTIADAPALWEVDESEDDDDQTPYERQQVAIHATDLDSNKTGWAGHLPGVHEKRLRMLLYPTVDRAEIYGRRAVTADVILVSKRGADGEFTPYLFHLLKVYPDAP